MQKFSGEGDIPSQTPPGAYGTSIFAHGGQAQRDTPEKNPSYGLDAMPCLLTYLPLPSCSQSHHSVQKS